MQSVTWSCFLEPAIIAAAALCKQRNLSNPCTERLLHDSQDSVKAMVPPGCLHSNRRALHSSERRPRDGGWVRQQFTFRRLLRAAARARTATIRPPRVLLSSRKFPQLHSCAPRVYSRRHFLSRGGLRICANMIRRCKRSLYHGDEPIRSLVLSCLS